MPLLFSVGANKIILISHYSYKKPSVAAAVLQFAGDKVAMNPKCLIIFAVIQQN